MRRAYCVRVSYLRTCCVRVISLTYILCACYFTYEYAVCASVSLHVAMCVYVISCMAVRVAPMHAAVCIFLCLCTDMCVFVHLFVESVHAI